VTTGPALWPTRGRAVPPRRRGDVLPGALLPRAGVPAQAPADLCPARGVSPGPLLEMTRSYITLGDPRGVPRRFLLRRTTSSGNDPTSASWPRWAGQLQAGLANRPPRTPSAPRRSRPPSCDFCPLLSTQPVVRRNRRAAVCLQETRSRRRRTPPTGSLASPRAARLSSATRELGLDAPLTSVGGGARARWRRKSHKTGNTKPIRPRTQCPLRKAEKGEGEYEHEVQNGQRDSPARFLTWSRLP